jgi:hypothetical protein
MITRFFISVKRRALSFIFRIRECGPHEGERIGLPDGLKN